MSSLLETSNYLDQWHGKQHRERLADVEDGVAGNRLFDIQLSKCMLCYSVSLSRCRHTQGQEEGRGNWYRFLCGCTTSLQHDLRNRNEKGDSIMAGTQTKMFKNSSPLHIKTTTYSPSHAHNNTPTPTPTQGHALTCTYAPPHTHTSQYPGIFLNTLLAQPNTSLITHLFLYLPRGKRGNLGHLMIFDLQCF